MNDNKRSDGPPKKKQRMNDDEGQAGCSRSGDSSSQERVIPLSDEEEATQLTDPHIEVGTSCDDSGDTDESEDDDDGTGESSSDENSSDE